MGLQDTLIIENLNMPLRRYTVVPLRRRAVVPLCRYAVMLLCRYAIFYRHFVVSTREFQNGFNLVI